MIIEGKNTVCSLPEVDAARSRNRNARARSVRSVYSFSSRSYSLAPLCVMSEANWRAALTSCILMGGGTVSSAPFLAAVWVALEMEVMIE